MSWAMAWFSPTTQRRPRTRHSGSGASGNPTVTAASELVTLKVTKDLFFRLITDFPEMGVEIMRVLAHRLEQTTAQLLDARAGS